MKARRSPPNFHIAIPSYSCHVWCQLVLRQPQSDTTKDSVPSLFVAAYPYEYLSTLNSTDHDVMQNTGCVKAGLFRHVIYFAPTLSLVNLIYYQCPHSNRNAQEIFSFIAASVMTLVGFY